MGHTSSATTPLRGAFPTMRTLSDAELHQLADELERRLRVGQRGQPAGVAHYSLGDYLKYEPDA